MMKILSVTDLSAPSRHAAHRAAWLAQDRGASMTLVHVIRDSALHELQRWFASEGGMLKALQADAWEQLQTLADELRQRYGVEVHAHLSVGHPVQEIVRHADAIDAQWLVTGTHGAGSLRRAALGSTAERIASKSSSPVLMARQRPQGPYRRVLVPVDFSGWSRVALDLARAIAPEAALVLMHAIELPFEGKLRLAGVNEDRVSRYRDVAAIEALRRLGELAADAGLVGDNVQFSAPIGGDPWMAIVQEEQARDCDLVVIGRHGRHAIDEFLLGSTTRTVIAEGTADVLIATRRRGGEAMV